MLFILLWGTDTVAHYSRLIPVYTTAASFLTAAWPSLLESMGVQPRSIQQLLRPQTTPPFYTPLDGISIDTEPLGQADSEDSNRIGLLHFSMRQTESPPPMTQPQVSSMSVTQEEQSRLLSGILSYDVGSRHPPSSETLHRADTITSISLSSRASWPSEMSSIVRPFFSPIDSARFPPRETSRRCEINALGRFPQDAEPLNFHLPSPRMPLPLPQLTAVSV